MAKILVVDDVEANRSVLADLLGFHQHQVHEASDGAEALVCIRQERPDLVISDILMPTMDGYELLRRIRSEATIAATRVIFASAHYLEREARALAHGCGVSYFLQKPLEPELVVDTVEKALADRPGAAVTGELPGFNVQHTRLLTDKLATTNEHLRNARDRLSAVVELCGELARERDPARILECLARTARQIVGARFAAVVVLPEDEGDVRKFHICGADAAASSSLQAAIDATTTLRALSLERPVVRLSALALPAPAANLENPVLAVSVNSLSHAYGWLCLVGKVGLPDFSEDDEQTALVLAGQTGRVYENGRLYRELMQRTLDLEHEVTVSRALADAGQQLITQLGTPTLAQQLCELTCMLVGCERSYTLLWSSRDEKFAFIAESGASREHWEAVRALLVPRHALAGVLALLEEVDIVEVATHEASSRWSRVLAEYGITRVLCAPLRRGTSIVGIQVAAGTSSRSPFTVAQRKIAAGIARIGSLALDNARLMLEIAEANRLKSDFVATMSHELRTPLNIIIGYNSLVRDGEFGALTPEQHGILGRVDESAMNLLTLINNLLDIGRLEVGTNPLVESEIDVSALLAEIRAELESQPGSTHVAIHWDLGNDLPLLLTDEVKLRVVLKNVLGNAIKFTDEGRIDVAARPLRGGVEIEIRDTGPGVPPDVLPFIFDAFRQGEPAATRSHGGVGLGLYIVQRLTELLGGTVNVESSPGAGTTFRVWIPAQSPDRVAGG
jgi:signal transduction histidine kinase/CheY-like chemotaxis protein